MVKDVEVSKEEFYAGVGQLDVHPYPDVNRVRGDRYHTSYWKLLRTPQMFDGRMRAPGTVIGRSVSDGWGVEPGQYFERRDR